VAEQVSKSEKHRRKWAVAKQKAWKGESTSPGTNSLVTPDSIGRQEHYSMTVEDFRFGLDENNMESVEFIEDPT